MSAPARTDDEAGVTSQPAAESDESALVRAVQAGDLSAFDQLVRAYMRRAFAVAFRVLGHREDAEDLVQDVFLVALEQIHTFDASRPFAPWFFRILVNRGLNARKSRARRRTEQIPSDAASGPQHSAIAALERGEIRTRFEAALKGLPDRQQLVVTLSDLEGFSGAEIANMLGISQGTIRWYLHQARHALRSALAPLYEGETHNE